MLKGFFSFPNPPFWHGYPASVIVFGHTINLVWAGIALLVLMGIARSLAKNFGRNTSVVARAGAFIFRVLTCLGLIASIVAINPVFTATYAPKPVQHFLLRYFTWARVYPVPYRMHPPADFVVRNVVHTYVPLLVLGFIIAVVAQFVSHLFPSTRKPRRRNPQKTFKEPQA